MKIVCLVPIIVTMSPKKQFPKIAPSDITDPIHDISLTEISPVSKGLFEDRSNGSAIDNQPNPQPNPTIIKSASFVFKKFEN